MENRIALLGASGDEALSGGKERLRRTAAVHSAALKSPSYPLPVSTTEKARPHETCSGTTLVLGIGNSLRRDDGAGIHAIHYLRANYPASPDVVFMDGGTLGFTLAGPIAEADRLIVIDATNLAAAPGTVRLFQGAEMDGFLINGKKRTTAHEAGLVDLMLMAQWTNSVPRQRALIGIQPESLDIGEDPNEAVRRAIPAVCNLVMELIARWQA
jgi:hydrogenase maturation protease